MMGKCRIKLYGTSAIQQHTAPQCSAVFCKLFVWPIVWLLTYSHLEKASILSKINV